MNPEDNLLSIVASSEAKKERFLTRTFLDEQVDDSLLGRAIQSDGVVPFGISRAVRVNGGDHLSAVRCRADAKSKRGVEGSPRQRCDGLLRSRRLGNPARVPVRREVLERLKVREIALDVEHNRLVVILEHRETLGERQALHLGAIDGDDFVPNVQRAATDVDRRLDRPHEKTLEVQQRWIALPDHAKAEGAGDLVHYQ